MSGCIPSLNVRLFGKFRLYTREQSLEQFVVGKAREMFCYLLTHRQRPIAREILASILWGECTTEHSRKYLRKALWQFQRPLTSLTMTGTGGFLKIEDEWVGIDPHANIWLDVAEFEQAFAGSHAASHQQEDCDCINVLEPAVSLYEGDLLEGWYQDWCLYERERLQNMYLTMLDKLVCCSEARHEYERGIEYGLRILRCDRAHEVAHQRLMRIRYLAGDRAGAIRQYEHCAAALKEELGVPPSERTRDIYQKICFDHPLDSSSEPLTETLGGTSEHAVRDALARLRELKATLASLQSAIDETETRVAKLLGSHARVA